jgi:predicted permease
MGIWGWVGTIAAAWFALSVVIATGWVLGRRVFRKTPVQQQAEDNAQATYLSAYRSRKAGA